MWTDGGTDVHDQANCCFSQFCVSTKLAANPQRKPFKLEPFQSLKKEQCTYNVTLRRVRESLLPWKRNMYYLLVCLCMRYRACVHMGTRALGRVHAHTCMQPF